MKAIVKTASGHGNVVLKEMPEPEPGAGQVKIKVGAAGICGSDIHIFDGDIKIPMKPPVIIGHEFAGTVDTVGEGVEGLAPGDRVTSETAASTCRTCRYCRTGQHNLCDNRRGIGYWINGAFAEYCVVPAEKVHILPQGVDITSAALCEPLACCVHGVNELTDISAGERVLLTGPGPIGLLSMQLAKAEGGLVIVCGTSPDEARLKKAVELGADMAVNIEKEDLNEVLKSTGLPDVVLECSGAPAAAELGLTLVRKGGKYTQIGLFGRPIEIDFEKIAYKELTVKGTFSQRWTAWHTALDLLSLGKVQTAPLISDILPLEQWEAGFEKHRNKQGLKILFKPE